MTCRLAADRAVLVDLHGFWSCRGGAVPDDSLFDEQTQGNNGDEDTRHFPMVRKRRVVRQQTEVTMGMSVLVDCSSRQSECTEHVRF